MARIRESAVQHKMYRHFAVVTVALTGTLAFFAEGERGKADGAAPVAQISSETPEAAARQVAAPEPAPQTGWADDGGTFDFDTSFGNPMGGSTVSSYLPSFGGEMFAARGYSPEYLALLSDEERRALEAELAANRREEIERAEQASKVRSGAADRE